MDYDGYNYSYDNNDNNGGFLNQLVGFVIFAMMMYGLVKFLMFIFKHTVRLTMRTAQFIKEKWTIYKLNKNDKALWQR